MYEDWTTEALLTYALVMLDSARAEQMKRKPTRNYTRWLDNNTTLDAIRERVSTFDQAAPARVR
jgi:hypothetical protein